MLHLVEIYKSASGEQIRAEASPARQCTAVCHTDTDTGKSVTQTQTGYTGKSVTQTQIADTGKSKAALLTH